MAREIHVSYESEDSDGNAGVITYHIGDDGPIPVNESDASDRAASATWTSDRCQEG